MSPGVCSDNALAESFSATLKRECIAEVCYPTYRTARSATLDFKEAFDNRQRLHAMLGPQSPLDFESRSITPNLVSTETGQAQHHP